jgi:NTE family protein
MLARNSIATRWPCCVRRNWLRGPAVDRKVYNIVHLIYRATKYEGHSKDYEFSRLAMEEHWRAGYHDARRTLRHRELLERPTNHEGVLHF